MNWTLFEGQLLNFSQFIRFYVDGSAIYGIAGLGYRILIKEFGEPRTARDGLVFLLARIERAENKNGDRNIRTQANQPL